MKFYEVLLMQLAWHSLRPTFCVLSVCVLFVSFSVCDIGSIQNSNVTALFNDPSLNCLRRSAIFVSIFISSSSSSSSLLSSSLDSKSSTSSTSSAFNSSGFVRVVGVERGLENGLFCGCG